MTDYNGWKNKETWLVNLWLGDTFAAMQEDGHQISVGLIESVVYESLGDLSDKSEEGGFGFMCDMLNCALGEIDYRELAEHYADDMAGADD